MGSPPTSSSSPPGPISIPAPVIQQNGQQLSPSQGVGVGISPAATSEAMDVPGGGQQKHVRRGSER